MVKRKKESADSGDEAERPDSYRNGEDRRVDMALVCQARVSARRSALYGSIFIFKEEQLL